MPQKVFLTDNPPKKMNDDDDYEEVGSEEILMKWEAPEFIQFDRPKSWYIILLGVAILLVIYSLITKNFLLAIIVVMLAIVINTLTRKKPDTLKVAVTQKGVLINDNLYTFEEDLDTFWILYSPPDLKTLNFGRRQRFAPQITIQLNNANPLKVRELLLEYLEEDVEREEHVADRVSRRLGF